ncbi:spore-associated protein A [Actinoallomurus sp. CA-142502]|uniref:spore-associated protein A n=1 Tax=Actinoallomurus sp. CA-142502 TaxID=3239885 RepID=UPI003D8BC16B
MKITKRSAAALALAAAAAVTGSVATSTPASAASSPIAACNADGTSYHEIDSHDLGPAVVYLMYNGTKNCVVTWKDSPNGNWVDAQVEIYGTDDYDFDGDYYSTYAGPVRVTAPGKCIDWEGTEIIAGHQYYWDSGKSHCG